jgi:cell division protein FtsA
LANLSSRGLPPAPPDLPQPRPRGGRAGPFGVLDVGSTKVTCLIGRVDGDGGLRVLGFGWQQARGVKGGGITDLDQAEGTIRRAVAEAEQMADTRLRSVTANLTCGQPESRLFNVQWPIGGRPITEADLKRILHEGRARAAVDGRECIHALPLGFTVDGTTGVQDPRGLHCDQLVARLHLLDAGSTALRNLGLTVSRCELDVAEMVSAPFAAGLATLVEDERQLGATVLDMGGGTTGMAVFSEGHLLHTGQLPLGGVHVTNDIARLLSTPVADAERLKTLYGNVEGSPDDEREWLPVPLVGEAEHRISRVPRSKVVSIIRPRLEEIFELVRDRLVGAGLGREAGNRVVLTGGASQLAGVRDMASRVLGREVRLGKPPSLRGLPALAGGPGFATAAGLLAWASGEGRPLADVEVADDRPRGALRRVAAFLRDRV